MADSLDMLAYALVHILSLAAFRGPVVRKRLLARATASRIPDLLAGGLIFLIVARGARQILALSASAIHRQTQ